MEYTKNKIENILKEKMTVGIKDWVPEYRIPDALSDSMICNIFNMIAVENQTKNEIVQNIFDNKNELIFDFLLDQDMISQKGEIIFKIEDTGFGCVEEIVNTQLTKNLLTCLPFFYEIMTEYHQNKKVA